MERFDPEEEKMFVQWEKQIRGPWPKRVGRWIIDALDAEGERIREFGLSPDDFERQRRGDILRDSAPEDDAAS